MKKAFSKIFRYIVILLLILFTLTGCSGKKDENKIKAKVNSELKYLENEIFTIFIKYAKDEYKTEEGFNWDSVYKEAEKLNKSLATIITDMSELNIPKDSINSVSNEFSNLVISISDKKEIDMFNSLYNAYVKFPEIEEIYLENNNEINKTKLKVLVLSAYKLSEFNDFDSAKQEIQNASDKYNEMIKDVNYSSNNQYNLNKIVVEIEELKSAINLENILLVRMRFVNFMEEM